MKKLKAKELENISEGVVAVDELMQLQDGKMPQVTLMLKSATDASKYASILITRQRGPIYKVLGIAYATADVKPYKYLACAVKRAVKEYKAALRTNKWRIMAKAV